MPQTFKDMIETYEAREAFYKKRGHRRLIADDLRIMAEMADTAHKIATGRFPGSPFAARQRELARQKKKGSPSD